MIILHLCRECGKPFFSWRKLSDHLIGKHDYAIQLEESEPSKEEPVVPLGHKSEL